MKWHLRWKLAKEWRFANPIHGEFAPNKTTTPFLDIRGDAEEKLSCAVARFGDDGKRLLAGYIEL